jgi:hypothetical protein
LRFNLSLTTSKILLLPTQVKIMKRIALLVSFLAFIQLTNAQETQKKQQERVSIANRAGDHFLLQFTRDTWTGMPDSIDSHQGGFSRGFNAYLMFDKPFRNSPKFSVALGVGYGSSNIKFDRMGVDVKSVANPRLPFTKLDTTNHFKKFKLHLGYLELPVELRFSSKPLQSSKSFKLAIGGKVGTLINAHTKGKDLQNRNNTTINSYTEKQSSKRFFNTTRLTGTARIGYGIFSLYGSYSITGVLKDAAGADMKLVQLGLSIGGL